MNRLDKSERSPRHDGVLEQLRLMIIRCELQPGDRISESDLGQIFGVSRTPLREALKILAAEKLVDLRPHRGAVVASICLETISETFDLMSALELMAGPLVCERVSNIELQKLEELVEAMDTCHANGDLMQYFELNTRFHNQIIALTGNKVLHRVYVDMFGKLQRARYRVNYNVKRWKQSAAEHHRIMEALRERDGEELGRRLKEHNTHTATAVMEGLKAAADESP